MLRWIKKGLLIFSITLFLLLGIEILSGLIIKSTILIKNESTIITADIYPSEDKEAIQEMFKEHAQIEYQWEPFLQQRAQPFKGKYININDQLIRKTEQIHSVNDTIIKIFAFGGSTMFGDGARDNYTIPSWLSKMIINDSLALVHISNYGNSAYIRTHENILLMRELQKGNIPDIVVFYDGVNDVLSCGLHHAQGLPQSAENREEEFNVQRDRRKLITMLIQASYTLRLLKQILPKKPFSRYENTDFSILGRELINHYKQNLTISDALAKEYGFTCINYWQPVVYSKENLTVLDKKIISEIPYYAPYFKAFYHKIKEDEALNTRKDFRNISYLLDETSQYYYDFCHISEKGNQIVAAEMFKDIKLLIQAKSQAISID